MIEGTRPFRGKNTNADTAELVKKTDASIDAREADPAMKNNSSDVNSPTEKSPDAMDRRAWFSSLVPALGDGLVKILRESNHLRDSLKNR